MHVSRTLPPSVATCTQATPDPLQGTPFAPAKIDAKAERRAGYFVQSASMQSFIQLYPQDDTCFKMLRQTPSFAADEKERQQRATRSVVVRCSCHSCTCSFFPKTTDVTSTTPLSSLLVSRQSCILYYQRLRRLPFCK